MWVKCRRMCDWLRFASSIFVDFHFLFTFLIHPLKSLWSQIQHSVPAKNSTQKCVTSLHIVPFRQLNFVGCRHKYYYYCSVCAAHLIRTVSFVHNCCCCCCRVTIASVTVSHRSPPVHGICSNNKNSLRRFAVIVYGIVRERNMPIVALRAVVMAYLSTVCVSLIRHSFCFVFRVYLFLFHFILWNVQCATVDIVERKTDERTNEQKREGARVCERIILCHWIETRVLHITHSEYTKQLFGSTEKVEKGISFESNSWCTTQMRRSKSNKSNRNVIAENGRPKKNRHDQWRDFVCLCVLMHHRMQIAQSIASNSDNLFCFLFLFSPSLAGRCAWCRRIVQTRWTYVIRDDYVRK